MKEELGKEHMLTWRYGHILVYKAEDPEEEDVCELVELYMTAEGEPHSWSPAFLGTVEDIRMALRDAEKHPVVTKFYDEGTFKWTTPSGGWDWQPNNLIEENEE
tara:strand:+ start:1807 stop:2118 length:312 start_codon:yes stop_codon:yes gene_type:complete